MPDALEGSGHFNYIATIFSYLFIGNKCTFGFSIEIMFRGIFAGFIIFILLFQSLDRFGMIAYYELNKAYITEMFCVNKSRPALQCDGQCFLMKKLKQQDQQNEKIPASVVDSRDLQMFPIQEIKKINFDFVTALPEPEYAKSFISRTIIHDVFHPPKLLFPS